jgi:phosphopantetheinyl transferase
MTWSQPGAVAQVGHAWVLVLERVPGVPHVVLGPQEQKMLDDMPWPRRRNEWLWGRFGLKMLVQQVLHLSPESTQIVPLESGAPVLLEKGLRRTEFVSLSHTQHFTAAALSEHPVGIDVCEMKDGPRMVTLASKVFSSGEAEAIGAHRSAHHQAAVWAIKEAALKLRQGGVFVPGVKSIRIASLDPPVLADASRHIHTVWFEKAVVAVASEA